MGVLVDFGATHEVFLPDLDLLVRLSAASAELNLTEISGLFYTTSDCTGQAYTEADVARPSEARFHPGTGRLAVIDGGVPPELIVLQSVFGPNPDSRLSSQNNMLVVPITILPIDVFDYLDDLVPPLYVAPL